MPSGVPNKDNHTAMSIDVISLVPSGLPIHVTVFDKQDVEVGKLILPGIGQKQFVGLIMGGGKTIGRVNVWDSGRGQDGGPEGITQLEVFVPAPAALALLGMAGLVAGRRRRR